MYAVHPMPSVLSLVTGKDTLGLGVTVFVAVTVAVTVTVAITVSVTVTVSILDVICHARLSADVAGMVLSHDTCLARVVVLVYLYRLWCTHFMLLASMPRSYSYALVYLVVVPPWCFAALQHISSLSNTALEPPYIFVCCRPLSFLSRVWWSGSEFNLNDRECTLHLYLFSTILYLAVYLIVGVWSCEGKLSHGEFTSCCVHVYSALYS